MPSHGGSNHYSSPPLPSFPSLLFSPLPPPKNNNQGEWSDNSPLWAQHPSIKARLQPEGPKDDGAFWMSFADFSRLYTTVDVCDRKVDVSDVAIDLHEAAGCCGPCYGCLCGCAQFWLGCQGPCYLYCLRHRSAKKSLSLGDAWGVASMLARAFRIPRQLREHVLIPFSAICYSAGRTG